MLLYAAILYNEIAPGVRKDAFGIKCTCAEENKARYISTAGNRQVMKFKTFRNKRTHFFAILTVFLKTFVHFPEKSLGLIGIKVLFFLDGNKCAGSAQIARSVVLAEHFILSFIALIRVPHLYKSPFSLATWLEFVAFCYLSIMDTRAIQYERLAPVFLIVMGHHI